MRARDAQGRFVGSTKTLTASVSDVPADALDKLPRGEEGWQNRAWKLWRILGVLHYPTSFMAEQMMRLSWNVEVDGKELEEEQAAEAVEAVTLPIGVREASRRLALNVEVAGEVFYIRKNDEWATVSRNVPKFREALEGADIIVRGWLADPTDPTKADSPVRAALDVAEEIRVLSALSRSQTRNRLAQRGILLRPKEAQFPEGDDFRANFRATITAPISDEYSAAAVTPLDIEFPGDLIEKWRHLVLEFPFDDKLDERLEKAIRRLALSLNMPPEVLLGNIDSNHWNAWLSEESTYRAHIEPLAMIVGDIFGNAMSQATNQIVKVTPDPAELLARRQSVADSFRALELGVVGFDYVRRQIGADDDDAPTEEELRMLLLLIHGAETAAMAPAIGTGQTPAVAPALPGTNGNGVQASVRTDQLDELGRQLLAIDTQLLGHLKGAAAVSVEVARERNDDQDVGVQEHIAKEMERLGRAWDRQVTQARGALAHLGIDSSGPMWDQAQEASVHLLVDGMTDFVTTTLDRTDSEMPALPGDLLRQVIATAGGTGTTTVAALPPPSFADPQGFAIGVLSVKDLKSKDVDLVQWRFRYGPLTRSHPFLEHKQVDGQFMTSDGETSEGWYPGDHKGCECWMDPMFRDVGTPEEVEEFG